MEATLAGATVPSCCPKLDQACAIDECLSAAETACWLKFAVAVEALASETVDLISDAADSAWNFAKDFVAVSYSVLSDCSRDSFSAI